VRAVSRAHVVKVVAFREPPSLKPSYPALLSSVQSRALAAGNVYGKPLTKSEIAALEAVSRELRADQVQKKGDLAEDLLAYVQKAVSDKDLPLVVVEGAMVVLEQLYLLERVPSTQADPAKLQAVLSREGMERRWQLVIGADVGAIQYIPAVEELEVALDGSNFNLDTDLDFLFTGFSGDSAWLSPGHLRYHVRRIRLEARPPKGWTRANIWRRWRALKGLGGAVSGAAGEEPDYGMAAPTAPTCRPDPSKPAVTLPLPFPENELFSFASNSDVMCVRSKLGGLIALRNVRPRIMGIEVHL